MKTKILAKAYIVVFFVAATVIYVWSLCTNFWDTLGITAVIVLPFTLLAALVVAFDD